MLRQQSHHPPHLNGALDHVRPIISGEDVGVCAATEEVLGDVGLSDENVRAPHLGPLHRGLLHHQHGVQGGVWACCPPVYCNYLRPENYRSNDPSSCFVKYFLFSCLERN